MLIYAHWCKSEGFNLLLEGCKIIDKTYWKKKLTFLGLTDTTLEITLYTSLLIEKMQQYFM